MRRRPWPVRFAGVILLAAATTACSTRAVPHAPVPRPGASVVVAPPADETGPLVREASPAVPASDSAPLATSFGEATYYADYFHGRTTASGITFSNNEFFAAHRTYPFGTLIRVTNLSNQKDVVVLVVDRGPFGSSDNARRTIIDVSRRAAEALDFVTNGRVPVRVDVLEWGS